MTDFYSKTWKDHVPWVLGSLLAVVAVAVLVFGGSRLWGKSSDETSQGQVQSSGDGGSENGGTDAVQSGDRPKEIGDLFVGADGGGLEEAANVAVEFGAEATSLEHGVSVSEYHDRISDHTDEELASRLSIDETVNELHEDLKSWEEDLTGSAQIYRLQADGTGKIDVSVHLHTATADDEYDLGPMTVSLSTSDQGAWEVNSVFRPIH